MTFTNHYANLGVAQTAPTNVIRAAYKALALEYHPDKQTKPLSPAEKVSMKSRFDQIQAAHEVLCDKEKRAEFDAQLATFKKGLGGLTLADLFDDQSSNANSSTTTPTAQPPATSTAGRKRDSFVSSSSHQPSLETPPNRLSALRRKAEKLLSDIRFERAKCRAQDSEVSLDELKDTLRIWTTVADENRTDSVIYAHCLIKEHEYRTLIFEKLEEKRLWLKAMSTPKGKKKQAPEPTTAPTTSPTARASLRALEKQKAEEQRAAAEKARIEARALDKSTNLAARTAELDKKREAIRAQHEQHQRKVAERAKQHADRIRQAREKAAPQAARTSTTPAAREARANSAVKGKTTREYLCKACNVSHRSFTQWKSCNAETLKTQDDASFFEVV